MGRFAWTSRGMLAAAVVLYVLQLSPWSGIFVFFLGGPFITGLLLDGAMIALLVEALTGQVAFAWALVPVTAFGAYYGTYISQTIDLYHQNAALKAGNSGQVLAFDPARYSLVSDDLYVGRYAVPVIYSHRDDVPEGNLGHVLLLKSQCKFDRDPGGHMQVLGVLFDQRFKPKLCELSIPEAPRHTIVETVKSGDIPFRYDGPSGRQVTQIVVNGEVVGSSTILMSQRLSLFPLFIAGCGLIDATSSWQCMTQFMTRPVFVNGQGFTNGIAVAQSEATMLGLHQYSETELDNFQPDAATAPEATRAAGQAAKTMDDMMTQLRALVSGEDIAPVNTMAYAVTREPEKLAPLAQPLADRFTELAAQIVAQRAACPLNYNKPPPLTAEQRRNGLDWARSNEYFEAIRHQRDCRAAQPEHPNRREQMHVLAYALSALPSGAFDTIKQRVGDSVMTVAYNGAFDKLYERLGRQPERCTYKSTSPLCDR